MFPTMQELLAYHSKLYDWNAYSMQTVYALS